MHGEAVAGVEEFTKKGEARFGGRVAGAEDFGAMVSPKVMEGATLVGPGSDDALGLRSVDDFPRFADRLGAGKGAGEPGG